MQIVKVPNNLLALTKEKMRIFELNNFCWGVQKLIQSFRTIRVFFE